MQMHLTDWTRSVVDVLAHPAGRQQLQALAAWLRRLSITDHFVLFVYEGSYRPLSLFDTFTDEQRCIFIDEYQTGPYLLDPFYLAGHPAQSEGVYSMRQLAPDQFYNSEYFLTYYHHLGLCEEVGFFITLRADTHAVLSLMRRRGRTRFHEDEIRQLESAMPVVSAAVRAAWEANSLAAERPVDEHDHLVQEAFANFGRGLLTERECEVVRLLLQGHSSQSIAQKLRISPATVKVHRKNLYEKLEIGSQSELLALFIQAIKGESSRRPSSMADRDYSNV
ncbi:helix-turn-helix transcriptional regulator [Pseudomonas alkylphenolica]|uniref:helix-turn-helix transcriptional regulator n=1 Tax=Pseudomonas alkylphenolica TaxID=237609 RepID=UPI0018D92698|nr:LuxR C-terminal-related transcriptional regulator [Pseudomonas alkylphenolica]MBH3426216.1 LuxR family transcriptional regulator [Pseudomonas alkylphenolica]